MKKLLMQTETKRKKKDIIPVILSIIFVIILFWTWIFSKIIVNEEIFQNSWNNYLAVVLGILTIIFVEYKLRTSKRYIENFKKRNKGRLREYLPLLIVVALLSKIITDRAIFVILHTFSKKESVNKIVYVKDITEGHGFYRNYCGNRIELSGYKMFGNDRICGIKDKIFKKIEIGQKVIINAEESYFGFTPISISFTDKIENK